MARSIQLLGDQPEFTRVCYYGPNGSGKSTAMVDMARLGPVAIINSEQGLRKHRLMELGIPIENMQISVDNSAPNLPDVTFEALSQLFWDLKEETTDPSPATPVGLVWDTATDSQITMLTAVRRMMHGKGRAFAEKSGQEYATSEYDMDDKWWSIITGQLDHVIRQFRDLPMHWAIGCQLERRESGDAPTSIGPAVFPSIQSIIMGSSDYVIRLGVESWPDGRPLYLGWSRPESPYKAKDRDGVLPNPMVDPTFTRIHSYATRTLTALDDPVQQAWTELTGGELPSRRPTARRRRSEMVGD